MLVGDSVQVRETDEQDSDEEEEPEITKWEAIGWLAVLTVCISVLSGYLVDAIQVITMMEKKMKKWKNKKKNNY